MKQRGGRMHSRLGLEVRGRRMSVDETVAVDDADVAAFKELQDLGVELEIRRVPSTPVEDTDKLFS